MNRLMDVKLGEKHTSVFIAEDIKDLSTHLSSYGQNVLWVFDSNTAPLFKQLPSSRIVLDSGEKNKTISSVEKILNAALTYGLSRDSRIIAFGGGVVCDMAALASSLYMRGCMLTLVPTTLLSMVDASLGGKTGVDFGKAKNIIGSFYPADEVLISTELLHSLNHGEYLSGLGEVIKHAFLSSDEALFSYLEENRDAILNRDKAVVREIVRLSLEIKKMYIEKDPKEKLGIRSFLNFGHTFAHALEALGHFNYSHGQAVAWGCVRAFEVGVLLGLTDKDYAKKSISLIRAYGYNWNYKIERGRWMDFLQSLDKDKKKYEGNVKFVICKKQGDFLLTPIELKSIQAVCLDSPWF